MMKPVSSGPISELGYDPTTRETRITFKSSGLTYAYPDVDPEEHEQLASAESIGKHFASHFRSKPCRKL